MLNTVKEIAARCGEIVKRQYLIQGLIMQNVYYAIFIPVDNMYAVIFPDFLGCNTQGESIEHAFAMAHEALEGHMEAMADDSEEIPTPSTKEEAIEKIENYYETLGIGEIPKEAVFFPVKAPVLDMRTKQIAVSFSKYKLDMIDRKAQALGMTRSGFLANAASSFDISTYA